MFRGSPTTTRLEGLVVWDVVSCLGVLRGMGIDDSNCGSGNWENDLLLIKCGGNLLSKDP